LEVLLALIGEAHHDAAVARIFHQRYLDRRRQDERALLQGVAVGELAAGPDIDALLEEPARTGSLPRAHPAQIPPAFIDCLIADILERRLTEGSASSAPDGRGGR
jgi:hypothetical protein